jgi:hypothetical protein
MSSPLVSVVPVSGDKFKDPHRFDEAGLPEFPVIGKYPNTNGPSRPDLSVPGKREKILSNCGPDGPTVESYV